MEYRLILGMIVYGQSVKYALEISHAFDALHDTCIDLGGDEYESDYCYYLGARKGKYCGRSFVANSRFYAQLWRYIIQASGACIALNYPRIAMDCAAP